MRVENHASLQLATEQHPPSRRRLLRCPERQHKHCISQRRSIRAHDVRKVGILVRAHGDLNFPKFQAVADQPIETRCSLFHTPHVAASLKTCSRFDHRPRLSRMPGQDWDLLSSYAGLLSLATLSVYCGAYGSLKVSFETDQRLKFMLIRVTYAGAAQTKRWEGYS